MQNFSQTGAKKKPTVCSVRKVPPMQIMSRMWWMRRLLYLPVMMISTHSARKTPREKMTKHWADTDTISITSSSEKDSLWIITITDIEEHRRAANIVLHFHPTLFANVRRKTIVTRAAVHTSNHGWKGRRGRRQTWEWKSSWRSCSVKNLSAWSLPVVLRWLRHYPWWGKKKADRRLVKSDL